MTRLLFERSRYSPFSQARTIRTISCKSPKTPARALEWAFIFLTPSSSTSASLLASATIISAARTARFQPKGSMLHITRLLVPQPLEDFFLFLGQFSPLTYLPREAHDEIALPVAEFRIVRLLAQARDQIFRPRLLRCRFFGL